MEDIPAGHLFLGEAVDADHERTGDRVLLEAADLTTHGVIVGMTGSGKTGLGVALIEEALLQGIPTLILDPKGDLGNLLLAFPDLAAESFAPWVEGDDAAEVAERWREGLAGWGMDGDRIQALRDAATFTIYTPGSTSGVGLDVVGSLQRPPEGTDAETTADEVQGFVSGLLRLVGIEADPLASREHILLANLVQHAWAEGRDLDLAGLVGQVQAPPLRKLGVFELDEFFPADDRTQLALRLNGLLASPAFAAWGGGQPLDIDGLLTPGGEDEPPGCAIVSLAHLSDDERQFVVTLVLSKLVTWMRRQPGTDRLRVLVYFDEVVGFVPPTATPPAKAPILTLLKQARAFGVGLVLATQNPVDVDYKALSNAGTWMIGRLQTEQDKARLLDGLASVTGGSDPGTTGDTIAGLEKREFVLRQAGQSDTTTFTSRWAMSYLRGPLTRDQIATLMADRAGPAPVAAAEAEPPLSDDATPVVPAVADGIPVRWVDPAAAWIAEADGDATSTTYAAAVAATVELLFDETKADLRHTETVEGILYPLAHPPDPASLVLVDHDPRDFREAAPDGAAYRLPDAALSKKATFTALKRSIVEHLLANRSLTLSANRELKLYSRPGETPDAFAARCEKAADDGADKAAAAMAKKMAGRIDRARKAAAAADDRVGQAEEAKSSKTTDELVSGAGDLLGSLLGGRGGARSIARKVGGLARRRGRASEAAKRVETASNRAAEKAQAVADLEADMADELATIADEWDAKAIAIEPLEVGLEKSDVRVVELSLVWLPV